MSKLSVDLQELEDLIEIEYNKQKDENTMLLLITQEKEDNLKQMDKLLFDVMNKNTRLEKDNNNLRYYNKIGQIIFATYIFTTSMVYLCNNLFF